MNVPIPKWVFAAAAAAAAAAILSGRKLEKSAWMIGSATWAELNDVKGAAEALGLSEISVTVDDQSNRDMWADWDPPEFIEFAEYMRGTARIVLGMWPQPDREFIDDYFLGEWGLLNVAKRAGSRTIELDMEGGNWDRSRLRGFGSHGEAGRYIVDLIHSAGLKAGVGTHRGRIGDEDYRAAFEAADTIVMQMYSRYNLRDHPREAWGATYGPGNMQHSSILRAQELFPGTPIVAGLAAYDQDYPEGKDLAMRTAAGATTDLGVTRLRWFGLRHLLRDPEAFDIVAGI